ncbi:FHA domain protein [Stieleria neptunia]|uniref:FHA domain protein n=1 Tax=Stieleria neptunia TaxID=2527979 RepID=A0A518HMR8_9BACT|nr:FHA domain-containing protein [Stieleria neptunia]QDV42146.1 FHA domain protein [Stieleria neptunia]
MRVILQVTAGPALGRQIPLQSGERARFGSSDSADVCFPEDVQMAEVHFELECQSEQCLVRDLSGTAGTFVNDEPVEEASIEDGDQIVAGQTQLRTVVKGRPGDPKGKPDESQTDQPVEPKLSAVELCQMTDLEEESLQLFRPSHTPEEFFQVLTDNQLFADAIRILSLYLPKRQAIYWAYRAVDDVFPRDLIGDERTALDVTMAWLKDPSEENRRAAMAIAEKLEFANAPSLVAAAACWSEGSMAPAEFDEVPPDPNLTAQMAAAAMTMTATSGEVKSINDRFGKITEIGKQFLAGDVELPA